MKYPLVAMVVVGLAVSGCQRKAEGQSVAVVDGHEITIPDLNFALAQARIPDSANKDEARKAILQKLIDRRLLAEQASKEGIDKTPEYLNRQRWADEELLISMLAARRLKTTQIPSDRDVDNYIASNPQMFANREVWDLDQVLYPTPSAANVSAQITGTHSMDDLVAVLQKNNIKFVRQRNRMATTGITPDVYKKVIALPAGEPFLLPVGDRSLATTITGKEAHPLTGDDAKPVAVAAMRKSDAAKSIDGLLKSLHSSAKIDYQPGYAPGPAKK